MTDEYTSDLSSLSQSGDERQRREFVRISLKKSQSIYSESDDDDAAIDTAFNELDLGGSGQLDRSELTIFLEEAARHIQLELEAEVIEAAVDALIEDAQRDDDSDGAKDETHITKKQFFGIFRRHPDMMRVFADALSVASLQQSVRSRKLTADEITLDEKENDEVWAHAQTHWKNRKVAIVWLILYFLVNVTTFVYKAVVYNRNEEAQAVFGSCINVARGAAQTLNFNCFVILLPICRHFLTRLRTTRLRWLFPFDAVLEIHMLVGIVIALFSTAHVAAHICDFYRFARADEDDIIALFGNKLGPIPDSIGGRWKLLLKQPAAITGIIMVTCIIVAYATLTGRRKAFNRFWLLHHLLLVMLIALCFHGIGSLLEPFQSVYWVIGPLVLYAIPRVFRETRCTSLKVLDISVKAGDCVALKLEKPSGWKNVVQSGMYAFLNIPAVSCIEWHPFTLTSAPHEDFIEFNFRKVGDWTNTAHDLLDDVASENKLKVASDGGVSTLAESNDIALPIVKVEGPIGASSQGFSDYPIVVLVGAGIGVTPMISVLKHLMVHPGKMKRTFFYWTVRDHAAFDWFASVMDEVYDSDQKHIIQIRHFLTSVKDDDRDLGAVLLHHAARSKHKRTDIDILLGRRMHHQVEVGRPLWDEELRCVRDEAKVLGYSDCGIFLCGPEKMAESIDETSFEISREDPGFHFYFNKETF